LSTLSRTRTLPKFASPDRTLSIGLETNGLGFLGFIVELPGAYVRGKTEKEALSKVHTEATAYSRWARKTVEPPTEVLVAQRHHCKLHVEDADCEILLDADRGVVSKAEFSSLVNLANYSGETFARIYEVSELKDWVDMARIRMTFWGEAPKTVREIFEHVNRTQNYYVSRAGLTTEESASNSFLARRLRCLERLEDIFGQTGNSTIFNVSNEEWTLRKILRRFIWHDRIHGKSIHRILHKQGDLGLIGMVRDPFRFDS